jgi:hypothetical protein
MRKSNYVSTTLPHGIGSEILEHFLILADGRRERSPHATCPQMMGGGLDGVSLRASNRRQKWQTFITLAAG